MRRISILVGLSLTLTLAACAEPGQQGQPAGGVKHPAYEAFEQRATTVAEAWRSKPGLDEAWRKGFVPLQDATVVPLDAGFTDETKQAFSAGWYRHEVTLPAEKPANGTIRFPDGTLDVPLVSAVQAYEELDQGDPPPCPGRPAEPPASPTGPDSPDSMAASACVPLTVTKATLGTVTVRTSRGEAEVPAWLFSIAELKAPIARLAVAPSAVAPLPEAPAPADDLAEGLVSVQDLTGVDGATLSYRLGVGACDTDITPLLYESKDVVVIGGAVTRSDGICTDQLVLEPVTITLTAPLGTRIVLDAASGQPLLLTTFT
ncbi:MAG TPA: hypothetical protein VFX61_10775 [Micromonosporaceae bacterium]|nr:hypothetical protein [Micromonosporaceae bacterium]